MKPKIRIINGPNLNLQGIRETNIYGLETFEELLIQWQNKFPQFEINYFQSNIEGEIINYIHQVGFESKGIIMNPGGYSHTSVAIADAIASITSPVIEVHISNIYSREEFRHNSITAAKCKGLISGLGMQGYELAISYFI